MLYFGTSIAPEDSITYFSPVEEGPVSPPGIGISQHTEHHFEHFEHIPFLSWTGVRLLFVRVAMMATLPGTMPRMMRPAPGQNYPRTGFPLEGKRHENVCVMFELVL